MRNILLILLLANILYFLWGWFGREDPDPGVAVVNESDLGPPMEVAQTPPPEAEAIASVGAVLGEGEETSLAAVVGRSCVTIGPLRNNTDADTAQTRYAGEGMRTNIRSGQGEFFVGHWVQIRDIPSVAASNEMLEVLHAGGLQEAYTVETEDEGIKISLGLFGNLDGAERVELQATSMGFNPDITPRTAEGTVYWVDIGLPPGRGAGEIIERYGEDQVRMREAATCPD